MEVRRTEVIMLPAKNQINQVSEGDMFINDSRKYSWGKHN